MTTFILKVDNARDRFASAWAFCCQFLELGRAVKVEITEAKLTRSLEQNDKFHAICGELAKKREWAGKLRDTEGWKRLLVDAWARVEGKRQAEIVPSLDGESIVNLGIQTRSMKVGEMADLITFAQSWCIDHDVELSQ